MAEMGLFRRKKGLLGGAIALIKKSCSFIFTRPLRQVPLLTRETGLRSPRPYEAMNIQGVTGLTHAQKSTLQAPGAINHLSSNQVVLA